MTREQYLFLLRAELTGELPEEELEEILRYYTEYFEEAGPERERDVMIELGSPQRLAGKILGRPTAEGMVPPEAAYGGGENCDYAPAYGGPERGGVMPRWLFITLAVIAGIVLVPAVGGTILGLGIGGLCCILAGLGVAVGGLFWGGLAVKLFTVGGGLMALAVGIVMLLGAVALVWACVKAVRFLRRHFMEGEYEDEALG